MASGKNTENDALKLVRQKERLMISSSHSHLKADRESGKLPKDLYDKIFKEGVPCYRCDFAITENTYGYTERTDEGANVFCYYCMSPQDA